MREEVAFQQVLSRYQQVAQAMVLPLVAMDHLEICVVRTKLEIKQELNTIFRRDGALLCCERGIKAFSYVSSQSDLLPFVLTAETNSNVKSHCYTCISIVTLAIW